jgi:hypothetical protein
MDVVMQAAFFLKGPTGDIDGVDMIEVVVEGSCMDMEVAVSSNVMVASLHLVIDAETRVKLLRQSASIDSTLTLTDALQPLPLPPSSPSISASRIEEILVTAKKV